MVPDTVSALPSSPSGSPCASPHRPLPPPWPTPATPIFSLFLECEQPGQGCTHCLLWLTLPDCPSALGPLSPLLSLDSLNVTWSNLISRVKAFLNPRWRIKDVFFCAYIEHFPRCVINVHFWVCSSCRRRSPSRGTWLTVFCNLRMWVGS